MSAPSAGPGGVRCQWAEHAAAWGEAVAECPEPATCAVTVPALWADGDRWAMCERHAVMA